MAEMIWKIGFDEQAATRAGKKAGQAQASESSKGSKKEGGGGAFAGGFLGSILGNILSSVKQLFDPLTAIASLLVAALFPILKPFLVLFIKVGLLLYKWLQGSLAGLGSVGEGASVDPETGQASIGEGLKSALFIIGAVIAGIVAIFLGAGPALVAAIAVLGGILISVVGGYFSQMMLNLFSWIDKTFGTNFIEPLIIYFNGISDIFNGLWNMLKSLLTLDWSGLWDGFKQFSAGIVGTLIGVFGVIWEALKTVFIILWTGLKVIFTSLWELLKTIVTGAFEVLKTLGTWLFDALKTTLKSSFSVLSSLGSWILNKIKSFFSFGGGGGSSVNDAIITPNGEVIRTNPSDYLIATKSPGDLFGGGGGGSKNITVQINGGLITTEVAREIGRLIQREQNYGGGF